MDKKMRTILLLLFLSICFKAQTQDTCRYYDIFFAKILVKPEGIKYVTFSEPVYENVTDTMVIHRKEANCNGSLADTTIYLTYEKRILEIPGRFDEEVIPAEYVTRKYDFNKNIGQKPYLFDGYKIGAAKGINTIQVDFYNEKGLLQKSLRIREGEEIDLFNEVLEEQTFIRIVKN